MSNRVYFPNDFDFVKFVARCYELSKPQGLGYLHYQPGPLADNYAQAIVQKMERNPGSHVALTMDYVLGRAVKMTIFVDKQTSRRYMHGKTVGWYDHTPQDLQTLIDEFGLVEE